MKNNYYSPTFHGFDFEMYIREAEPEKREKGYAWHTAIGLQAVDGLKPSRYLVETAIQNIEGKFTLHDAQERVDAYYRESIKHDVGDRTEEADKVSLRITQILSEKAFSFTPNEYLSIHRKLFMGIYTHAGKIREYNITKSEWILDGKTVLYGSASELPATLEYDLSQERNFSYRGLSMDGVIRHLAVFVARLWQIHVFGEGNTRTTAVFFIKYLRTLGFDVTNEIFAENAWYFRNALVRANYNDLKNGIHETTAYLELFLRNLLLEEHNELRNRTMHIRNALPKAKNADPINEKESGPITMDSREQAIYDALLIDAGLTRTALAEKLGCSDSTIKRTLARMVDKKILQRVGANKNGFWLIRK